MAVDANVLINERVREELLGGKTVRAAIDAGYSKALSAIIDSNITTFLTGIILYQFGTGPVQGFALTLMIGIMASMFSAIIITRVIFNYLSDRGISPSFG
jgi:preprotein translocase subunit SecD